MTLFFKTRDDCQFFLNEFLGTCEKRFGALINREKTKIVDLGERSLLGFSLDEYGVVRPRPGLTDEVHQKLSDLLTAPKSLKELLWRIKSISRSLVNYYKIVDDPLAFKNAMEAILNEIRNKIADKYQIYDLVEESDHEVVRIDELMFVDEDEILLELLPHL